jgi:preprotein translocase subunit SecE
VVSEDRPEQDEQDPRDDKDTSSSRPATAAARRERRTAGSRPAGRGGDTKGPDGKTTLSGRREERVSQITRLVRFIREVVAELRKVIWPTRKELVTYTIVVLIFVSFMVALVAGLDIVFAKGVFWLFG